MFERAFMDYHRERFTDQSLIVSNDGKVVALVPANTAPDGTFYSHQGLTFGGLVISPKSSAADTLGVTASVTEFLRTQDFKRAVLKVLPVVFCAYFREDVHYALSRNGWRLGRRDLSSVIDYAASLPYRSTKRHAVRKAIERGLSIVEQKDPAAVWNVIEEVLSSRHGTRPAHNAMEISLLARRFPDNIKCFTAELEGETLAVSVVFLQRSAVHTQYLAATCHGRDVGGLDFLLDALITQYKETYRWFSFGISTTEEGAHLNESLLFQKEGFGGRAIVHDFYELEFA